MKLRQPGANFISVKVRDRVKVINGSDLAFALLNVKEGRAHTKICAFAACCRSGIPKNS